LLGLILVVASWAGEAQPAARLTLAPPNGTLPAEFSSLSWVRELADGRIIITDGKDDRLVLADFRTGRVEAISHKGQGPGEYMRALPVWSIGGDSSLLMDSPRRWLLFDGARVVATLAPDAPALAAARGLPRGVDTVGHVYSAAFIPGQGRPIGDSTALLRVARGTAKVDTLTRLKALVPRATSRPDARGFFTFAMPTLDMADEAVSFPDGWLAVVRARPYRVEWRSPEGRWQLGAPLPLPVIRMDDREKHAYVDRMSKATAKPPTPIDSIPDWPATVPPYRSPVTIIASPEGRVVVPRLPSADHPETRYDLVNRRGVLDGVLVLPPNQRLLGFGARSVYTAVIDDDGIERLQRHPWPSGPVK
jgi:hypothetical protein